MAEAHDEIIKELNQHFVNCLGEKIGRNVGVGVQCMNDRNFFSHKNDNNCHNCYFHEQTCEVESEMDRTICLVCAKREIHVGTEFSMQHQNKQYSFTKISPCISKFKVLNNNDCFLHKMHPKALAKLMLSACSQTFPRSMAFFTSNKSDANHFSKISEINCASKESSWFNLHPSQNDQHVDPFKKKIVICIF